jgi:hypothetical protein
VTAIQGSEARGFEEDSVMIQAVTPTVSVAVMEIPETVSELEVAGIENAVTVGAVVSARVMVTGALRLAETLPAASLAQA